MYNNLNLNINDPVDKTSKLIQEYVFNIKKDNTIYEFELYNITDKILIKHKFYALTLSLSDFISLTSINFSKIEEIILFFKESFKKSKIKIDNINFNKIISLIILTNNKDKIIRLNLISSMQNKDFIINELYNKLSNEKQKYNPVINPQKIETQNDDHFIFSSNVNFSVFHTIKDSYNNLFTDNSFTCFESLDNITYLVYATENLSIKFYNLYTLQIISEIKNAHRCSIINFRHYIYDKKDVIMSISGKNNNIKLWDIISFSCILNFENINQNGYIYSACLINNDNQNYIVTSNFNWQNPENIKIYNFKCEKISELNSFNNDIYFIDSYYDNLKMKLFIITGNDIDCKSYDYNEKKIYKTYEDNDIKIGHYSVLVFFDKIEKITKLIDSCNDGFIRVWDFHLGNLINKINTKKTIVKGMSLWKGNYLFVGCNNHCILLIDVKNGKIIKTMCNHRDCIGTVKIIKSKDYGEYLISQGWKDGEIKLWNIEIN